MGTGLGELGASGLPAAGWAGAPSGRGLGPGVYYPGGGRGWGCEPGSAPPVRRPRCGARDPRLAGWVPLCTASGPARAAGAPRTARIQRPLVRRRAPRSQGWAATETFRRPEGRRGPGTFPERCAAGKRGGTTGPKERPHAAHLLPPRGHERGRCPETLPGALTWAQRRLGGTPGPRRRETRPPTRSGTQPGFAEMSPWAGSLGSLAFYFNF